MGLAGCTRRADKAVPRTLIISLAAIKRRRSPCPTAVLFPTRPPRAALKLCARVCCCCCICLTGPQLQCAAPVFGFCAWRLRLFFLRTHAIRPEHVAHTHAMWVQVDAYLCARTKLSATHEVIKRGIRDKHTLRVINQHSVAGLQRCPLLLKIRCTQAMVAATCPG